MIKFKVTGFRLKVSVLLFIFVWFLGVPQVSLGSPSYSGLWCQSYDDFIQVLKISQNDSVKTFSIGKQGGERILPKQGYVSAGVGQFTMVLDNEDYGVSEVRVGFSKRRKFLDLYFNDGRIERYNECTYAQNVRSNPTP